MDPHALRSDVDRSLAAQLLLEEHVRKARQALEEAGRLGTRRNLLAQALRLTRPIAPELHTQLDHCIEVLGVEAEVEVYVHADPRFNAGCTPVEDGRVFLLVTSGLLEGFSHDELVFVLGHELGHHIYGHHDIPLGLLLQHAQALPKTLILQAFTWQRHAEISCDRAGMLCCGGLAGAARGLFKLSSGLTRAPGEGQIQAFIEQAQDLYREDLLEQMQHHDWLSTHPFSPIRLRAAQTFQRHLAGEIDLASLEEESAELLALMEPSYLEEDSSGAEAMRRLLFAAAAVVANADGQISGEELAALTDLLGAGRVPRELNAQVLEGLLEERIERVKQLVSRPRRVQLVRDLVVIARADGHVSERELCRIKKLSRALQVDPHVVEVVLASPCELD